MSEIGEGYTTSALYKDSPEWKDVQPVYPSKDEECAVRIACTEQFGDAFAYLRAVLVSKEMSPRVLRLTEDCIQLNPANYTLWFVYKQFRRDLLKNLNIDFVEELKYLDGIIMETPKNYQVCLAKRFIETMPNNESVWNYLTGLLLDVGVTSRDDVMTFVEDLYDHTESPKRAAYLLYSELISLDPVRSNYWKHQQKVAENMLEKQAYKTVAK
uniref:Protein farnesyltransferase/geranylgeranyltransferase type-1 subunit alpha n=1 Tax=Heterorhabditis bacteriophora TaxID=37862 RepID=A0A1I7WMT5_HETBA